MEDIKYKQRTFVSETFIQENHSKSTLEISSEPSFCSIYVSKYRMNKEGSGIKLLQMLEDFNLYYRYIPDGVDALNLVLHEDQLQPNIERELIKRISTDLSADKVMIKRGLSLIMLTGKVRIHNNSDRISRAAKALAQENINIEMIHLNQNLSKISLLFGVKAKDEKKAVLALHKEFFTNVPV